MISTRIICNGSYCETSRESRGRKRLKAHQIREQLRREGWHNDGARDYCPDCWAILKRREKEHDHDSRQSTDSLAEERMKRVILALVEKLPNDIKRDMLAAFGDLDDMESVLDIVKKARKK